MARLEFLLRGQGDVVSEWEILTHVWDYHFEGEPNIVEVYVRHLRTELDSPFARDSITTVRGAGHRLAPDGGWPVRVVGGSLSGSTTSDAS